MTNPFRRTSFTTRLLALAVMVMALIALIDYVALLQLPSRVARDTVEIALRENVQSLNATFRDDQAELRALIGPLVEHDKEFNQAILARDSARLDELLRGIEGLNGVDVRYKYLPAREIRGSGIGVIYAPYIIQTERRQQPIVFYRPLGADVLDRAAGDEGEVHFAFELDGEFVATSADFPTSIGADELDSPTDPRLANIEQLEVDGEQVHAYSRALTNDPAYQLHAVSTPKLEGSALQEIRSDVRTAIGGMVVATVAAFLFLILFTSRTVRTFADRVRQLADGDYGTVMPVRGEDAFAELAGSVNRLSLQLQEQLGQLEQTARAFERTLETLEEGICVWDGDGQIQYWNHGAEQLTGLARERADRSDPVIAYLHAQRAPGTRRVTLPVRRSGSGLVVDLVVTAMPDGGILQTFRDTTLVDMLQQTQRNFMATAAHELRTPITTILGFADTLTNPELQLTERQRDEFLDIITEQSQHLQELTEAFFTSHQLANERVEVSIIATPVEEVVEEALEREAAANPERAKELGQIDVDIPRGCAALADRRALVGIVAALVDNALKYGAGPRSITAEQTGATVTLVVRDSGEGIDLHHQARVFDPFFRVDVDMRSGVGGAGLGLFTARKLVEAMHGVIRVRSGVGDGTAFIVELPAAIRGPGDDAAPALEVAATARRG